MTDFEAKYREELLKFARVLVYMLNKERLREGVFAQYFNGCKKYSVYSEKYEREGISGFNDLYSKLLVDFTIGECGLIKTYGHQLITRMSYKQITFNWGKVASQRLRGQYVHDIFASCHNNVVYDIDKIYANIDGRIVNPVDYLRKKRKEFMIKINEHPYA